MLSVCYAFTLCLLCYFVIFVNVSFLIAEFVETLIVDTNSANELEAYSRKKQEKTNMFAEISTLASGTNLNYNRIFVFGCQKGPTWTMEA